MKLFIVAVPVFSSEMAVESYILEFQSGTRLFGLTNNYAALDGAMHSPGVDLLNQIGIEPFTGGKKIFVPVNQYHLLAGFDTICQVPPESVICMLPNNLPASKVYIEKCRELIARGYTIALNEFNYTPESAPLFQLADFIIFDTTAKNFMDRFKLARANAPGAKTILTEITDKQNFLSLRVIPNTLFQGQFYNQPITKGTYKIAPLKVNTVELLKLLGEEDFDLEKISATIQRDAALSISLLRFINSPAIGLSGKINSIKHAVAMLGQKETKKWVTAAASNYMAEDRPNEIAKVSMTRAKFAENLALAFQMEMQASSLFLIGLFSMLDIIMEMPMEKAVREISLDNNIREALVEKSGPMNEVLELIYAYEQANWQKVSYIMVLNEIKVEDINKAFIDALVWYRELLDTITE